MQKTRVQKSCATVPLKPESVSRTRERLPKVCEMCFHILYRNTKGKSTRESSPKGQILCNSPFKTGEVDPEPETDRLRLAKFAFTYCTGIPKENLPETVHLRFVKFAFTQGTRISKENLRVSKHGYGGVSASKKEQLHVSKHGYGTSPCLQTRMWCDWHVKKRKSPCL